MLHQQLLQLRSRRIPARPPNYGLLEASLGFLGDFRISTVRPVAARSPVTPSAQPSRGNPEVRGVGALSTRGKGPPRGGCVAPLGAEPRKRLYFNLPPEAVAAGPKATSRSLQTSHPTTTPALGPRSSMEAEDFQEELTCSICLDYFEDPVSIECGHNFCRGCLRRSWAQSGSPVPCPECRQPSAPAAMRPNWALARLTERMRRRRLGPAPHGLCGRHWEPLRLFCEDDQRLVCLVCRESQEHQAHTMAPVDEAFASYRVSRPLRGCRYCLGTFTVHVGSMNPHPIPTRLRKVKLLTDLRAGVKTGIGRAGARLSHHRRIFKGLASGSF